MRKRLLWIVPIVASMGVFAMPTGSAGAATVVPNTPAPGTGPFDSQTVFCTKQAPLPGKRNASSPGVTPNSITIADNSIDAVPLKRLGVVVPDFHRIYQVWVDEVNKCGGINGRKLILKSALYNPLSPDLPSHFQSMCLKTTEDFKAFYSIQIGAPVGITRCIAVQHKTIIDAPAYATDAEFRDSKGRVFSLYVAADKAAEAFIADGKAQHTFEGKKITIVGTASGLATVVAQQRDQWQGGLKKIGVDADLEILPCDGVICTKGVGAAVRRIKQNGTNMIVLTTNFTATAGLGTFFREMSNQNVNATITGATFGSQHQDTTLASVTSQAGTDGMAWMARNGWTATGAEKIGEWRTGKVKDSTLAKLCNQMLGKAFNQPAFQLTEKTFTDWSVPVTTCIGIRAFARAVYSLGNNVTTERMVAALKAVKPDRRDTGPNPRDLYFFNGTDNKATKALTLQINYPCPLPLPRPAGAPVACAMPADSPMRFRTIKY